jgi:hypothetical protein
MSNVIRWIVRNALLILLFMLILGAGGFVLNELRGLDTAQRSMAALGKASEDLPRLADSLSEGIAAETRSVVGQSLAAQQQLLAEVNLAIAQLLPRVKSRTELLFLLATGGGQEAVEAAVLLELRQQQRRYLESLIRHTAALQDAEGAQRELARRWQAHKDIYGALEANRRAQQRIREENLGADWNLFSDGYEELQRLKAEEARLLRKNKDAHSAYQKQKALVRSKSLPARPAAFRVDSGPIVALRKAIEDEIRRLDDAQSGSVVGKVAKFFQPYFKAALWLWAIVMLTPYALRNFFYWVLAPLATRLPPIRIASAAAAPPMPQASASAVSVPVEVGPGSELLVKPDFLQSSSRTSEKQTQWLLSGRFPFASLAAGLWALTRVRSQGDEPTMVTVSCQQDAFGEVGLVHLPAGSAMVVQPRSLAGVLKDRAAPVGISRHWRLGSLHAWLSWQLRYLVFHGPCTLVVTGRRGIRAESPSTRAPRLIRQSATLAFSSNLGYQTIRHATFVPYLRGQEDLFCDLFTGGPGLFVYEEMPSDSPGGRAGKRGMEGVLDAVLKVFGV